PEWQRFVTLVKQSQELKHVSYHKLYDILKQHQHEVNEIRADKIARVANPLALVAQQQHDNSPRIHRNTGYEGQRSGTVAGARDTVGSSMVQKSGIQCYNCNEYGHVARECQKPKRAKDAAYHREKMLL
nr:Gag-Pol polyprotein [Tanacetum cinerariifolium]